MITDEEKYRAEAGRFLGITMLMPFGGLLLTPVTLFNQLGLLGFSIYVLVSILGLIVGATIIEAGRRVLDKREIKRWK